MKNLVPSLFSRFSLKGLDLESRFVLPGMQRGQCVDGCPLPELADYYRRRVVGGISLIISESCAIDHPAATGQPAAAWMTQQTKESWKQCVDAVHDAGGSMLIQLWHEGAKRIASPGTVESLSPSGLIQAGRPNGKVATEADLDALVAAYVRAAELSIEIGADGVEIHGAHGYLLDQFLWAETNRREDGLGGDDIRDRVRFPCRVVAAVRDAVGEGPIISFRFSQWKEVDYAARIVRDPAELKIMISSLTAAGVDLFNVSVRRFTTPEWPESSMGIAGWAKQLSGVPVITVGSIGVDIDLMDTLMGGKIATPRLVPDLIELARRFDESEFDLVAIGRCSIADPDWVAKVREGRLDAILPFTREQIVGQVDWDTSVIADAYNDSDQ